MTGKKEVYIERYLVEQIEAIGGICLKLEVKSSRGWPDRLCVVQDKVFFVECKRPVGARLSQLQRLRKHRLERLGAMIYVLKNRQQIDALIKEITR